MSGGKPSPINSYRDLVVWQKSMLLANMVHSHTKSFPDDEKFGLRSQIRRAAVSIPSNIAEGNGLLHQRQYLRHLGIARGSLLELETQLMLSRDFDYLTNNDLNKLLGLCDEIGRMLTAVIKKFRNSKPGQEKGSLN